jgi:hypothetical protein
MVLYKKSSNNIYIYIKYVNRTIYVYIKNNIKLCYFLWFFLCMDLSCFFSSFFSSLLFSFFSFFSSFFLLRGGNMFLALHNRIHNCKDLIDGIRRIRNLVNTYCRRRRRHCSFGVGCHGLHEQ